MSSRQLPNRTPRSPAADAPAGRVDKASFVPAYAQLAQSVRQRIADESYPPGSRLPSESALAASFGVSAMTARQGVAVLAAEGLVERVQRSGTFVRRVQVARSHFTLETLDDLLARPQELEVRIQKAAVERGRGRERERLGLSPDVPLISVERLLLRRDEPFLLQMAYTRFDPQSPIVETMLDSAVLTGLLSEQTRSCFKKGELELLPATLDAHEAELLGEASGAVAFRLEHLFYDFGDQPAAFGWLLISPRRMPLVSRVGVWDA